MIKVQSRIKIYEGEDIEQKVPLKTPTMANLKTGGDRYQVITRKQNYLDKNGKWTEATQFQDKPSVKKISSINNQQLQLHNNQHHLQHQKGSITANQNEVIGLQHFMGNAIRFADAVPTDQRAITIFCRYRSIW